MDLPLRTNPPSCLPTEENSRACRPRSRTWIDQSSTKKCGRQAYAKGATKIRIRDALAGMVRRCRTGKRSVRTALTRFQFCHCLRDAPHLPYPAERQLKSDCWFEKSTCEGKLVGGIEPAVSPETRNFLSGVISCRGLFDRTAVNGELPHRKDSHSVHEGSVPGLPCIVFPTGSSLRRKEVLRSIEIAAPPQDEISLQPSRASIMK